jgi:hypothetical protein
MLSTSRMTDTDAHLSPPTTRCMSPAAAETRPGRRHSSSCVRRDPSRATSRQDRLRRRTMPWALVVGEEVGDALVLGWQTERASVEKKAKKGQDMMVEVRAEPKWAVQWTSRRRRCLADTGGIRNIQPGRRRHGREGAPRRRGPFQPRVTVPGQVGQSQKGFQLHQDPRIQINVMYTVHHTAAPSGAIHSGATSATKLISPE